MHSSGMRTVRSSGRISGRCLLWGVYAWGVSAPGRCLLRGVSAPWGVSSPGGCLLLEGVVSQHALRQTPPPACGLTDACKNTTFATSLRTVIRRSILSHIICPLPVGVEFGCKVSKSPCPVIMTPHTNLHTTKPSRSEVDLAYARSLPVSVWK